MKYTLLAAAIAAISANALALSCKVVDENGEAVVGAHVEIVGGLTHYTTDEKGHFNILN